MTQHSQADKPDWVVQAEAKLRAFGMEGRIIASVHERLLTSYRVLRRLDRDAKAG